MQNRINDQPAFILHRRNYQDSSLILELFTQEFGRVSVLAKGARKRRDAVQFQMFNRLSIGWIGRSELKTLTHIESQSIEVPASCYLALCYINELLLLLLAKYDEHRDVFQRYQLLLLEFTHMEQNSVSEFGQNIESSLRNFEIDLLTALGLMPQLTHLGFENQVIQSGGFYGYEPSTGLYIAEDNQKNSYLGADLLAIEQREWGSKKTLSSAKRLLRQIIDFNLRGRQLQSRQLYLQMYRKQHHEPNN